MRDRAPAPRGRSAGPPRPRLPHGGRRCVRRRPGYRRSCASIRSTDRTNSKAHRIPRTSSRSGGSRMPRRLTLAALFTVALCAAASAETGERVSTLADQRAVGITIYNAELALVRDRRRVTLPAGESRLALRDVSAQIQPETALLQSVAAPGRISVLEQNF